MTWLLATALPFALGKPAVIPTPEVEVAAGLHHRNGLKTVVYNGPRYTMTPEDWARREAALAGNGTWERPRGMPIIDLEPGTHLDFGVVANHHYNNNNNGSLAKRSGDRQITAFSEYNCAWNSVVATATNFGCGTGCIRIPYVGKSGLVTQQKHGNPYPTMDVFGGASCNGGVLQHFGVKDKSSCTDLRDPYNQNWRFNSFIGYYDC